MKGAALLLVWFGDAIRPTKDVDLLGFGDVSADALNQIFADVCRVPYGDDGLTSWLRASTSNPYARSRSTAEFASH